MLHREKRVRQQRVLGWSVWEKASLKSSLAEGLAGPLLPRNGASVVLGCLAGRGSARHPLRRRGSEVISSWVWSSRSKRGRASVFFTFHPISCVHNPHLPRLETRKRCGAVQPRVRVSSTHPLDCDSRPRAGSSSRRRARSLCGCFFVDRGGARSWRHRAQISQPFAFPDDVLITPSCAQTRPNNRDCPRRPPRSASARRERTSSPHPRRRPGEERERESCCAALLWRSTSKNSSDQVFFFALLKRFFFMCSTARAQFVFYHRHVSSSWRPWLGSGRARPKHAMTFHARLVPHRKRWRRISVQRGLSSDLLQTAAFCFCGAVISLRSMDRESNIPQNDGKKRDSSAFYPLASPEPTPRAVGANVCAGRVTRGPPTKGSRPLSRIRTTLPLARIVKYLLTSRVFSEKNYTHCAVVPLLA